MKLNLGGGGFTPEGYIELDRKTGQEIYPLDYGDAAVAEIRASHVLEHFSFRQVGDVLTEWVRVLEPGGILKVAVPDFAKIAQWYIEKRQGLPMMSFIMGGQTDENDYHKGLFDEGLLTKCLMNAGLVDIKHWQSEMSDNASWEVSLNLQGIKPKAVVSKGTMIALPYWPNNSKAEGWPLSEAANVYSQYGEDGMLRAIFGRIGTANQVCVDVGAADGLLFSNVRQFIEQGWKGLLIESDEKRFAALARNASGEKFGSQFGHGRVTCHNYKVESSGYYSLDNLLARAEIPEEFDLLSIDVDGQEYYIWNSLLKFRPRVVVVEYDPQAEPMFIPPLNGPGQAGWNAMTYVGSARGYVCLARTATNLIFLRKDLLDAAKTPGDELVIIDPGDMQPETQAAIINPENTARPMYNTQQAAPEPTGEEKPEPVKIIAVASVPRLGFNATWHCTLRAMLALGIKMEMVEGAFWGPCLTRGIEKALAQGPEQIITIDYDTVFDVQHVVKLCQLLADNPEFDAVVPVQMKRECNQVLMQMNGSRDFSVPLTPILTGHFGLTVFDAAAFEKIPKPWFQGVPDAEGRWEDGHTDDDIWFWRQAQKAKLKVGLANEVRVGHLELAISWPDKDYTKIRQSVTDYREHGQPKECGGGLTTEYA